MSINSSNTRWLSLDGEQAQAPKMADFSRLTIPEFLDHPEACKRLLRLKLYADDPNGYRQEVNQACQALGKRYGQFLQSEHVQVLRRFAHLYKANNYFHQKMVKLHEEDKAQLSRWLHKGPSLADELVGLEAELKGLLLEMLDRGHGWKEAEYMCDLVIADVHPGNRAPSVISEIWTAFRNMQFCNATPEEMKETLQRLRRTIEADSNNQMP